MSTVNAPQHLPPLGSASLAAKENPDWDSVLMDSVLLTEHGFFDRWEVAQTGSLRLNWNKVFPYQFLILQRKDGKWVRGNETDEGRKLGVPGPFTLPIPPQSLSIDMAFASTVEATQGGIIEQNNGAPFREIVLQGTTGVLPLRGTTSGKKRSKGDGLVAGLFGGTVAGANTLVQNVATLAQSLGDNSPRPNVIEDSSFEDTTPDSPAYGTGYYQFLLLKRYFEWYAEAKKKKAFQEFALGFAVWKEREIYIVTPQKFTVSRNAGKALQYPYQIMLRAWRRVTLTPGDLGGHTDFLPTRDPNVIGQALSVIDQSRRTLENLTDTLKAIPADVENIVLTPLRQASLFCRDLLGVGFTLAEFPALGPVFEKSISTALKSFETLGQPLTVENAAAKLGVTLGQSDLVDSQLAALVMSTMGGYATQTRTQYAEYGAPTPKELWQAVQVDRLELPAAARDRLRGAVKAASQSRQTDFSKTRFDIAGYLAEFSAAVGAGSDEFNALYGTPSTTSQVRTTPSSSDWAAMTALSAAVGALDSLAATGAINNTVPAVEVIAGLATNAGLVFDRPASKVLVPMLSGYTLEMMADRYLSNPDRWIEIATLNGLVSPYIDDTGRTDVLVNGGYGNSVAVGTTNEYVIGQLIWVWALGTPREKRRVLSVQRYDDFQLLQLDGEADLAKFTVALESTVFSYIPNTTNSQQFIYIPSSEPSTDFDWQTGTIPGVDYFDPMVRVGGMDIAVDDSGDLVIVGGATRLAVGLNNIIQQLKIGVGTPQGSLWRHPSFGFGVIAGSSTADVSAQQVLTAAKTFVKNHSAFTGVDYAAVNKDGNSLQISLGVGVRGISKTVPVSVSVQS